MSAAGYFLFCWLTARGSKERTHELQSGSWIIAYHRAPSTCETWELFIQHLARFKADLSLRFFSVLIITSYFCVWRRTALVLFWNYGRIYYFLYPGSLEELGVGKSESKMSSESKGENQTTKLVFVRDKTDKSRTWEQREDISSWQKSLQSTNCRWSQFSASSKVTTQYYLSVYIKMSVCCRPGRINVLTVFMYLQHVCTAECV